MLLTVRPGAAQQGTAPADRSAKIPARGARAPTRAGPVSRTDPRARHALVSDVPAGPIGRERRPAVAETRPDAAARPVDRRPPGPPQRDLARCPGAGTSTTSRERSLETSVPSPCTTPPADTWNSCHHRSDHTFVQTGDAAAQQPGLAPGRPVQPAGSAAPRRRRRPLSASAGSRRRRGTRRRRARRGRCRAGAATRAPPARPGPPTGSPRGRARAPPRSGPPGRGRRVSRSSASARALGASRVPWHEVGHQDRREEPAGPPARRAGSPVGWVRAAATRTGTAKSRTRRTEFDPSGLLISQLASSSTAVQASPARSTAVPRAARGPRSGRSPPAPRASGGRSPAADRSPPPRSRAATRGSSAPPAIHHGPAGAARTSACAPAACRTTTPRRPPAGTPTPPGSSPRRAPPGPRRRGRPADVPGTAGDHESEAPQRGPQPRTSSARSTRWPPTSPAATTPAAVQRAGVGREPAEQGGRRGGAQRPSRAIPMSGRPTSAPAQGPSRL